MSQDRATALQPGRQQDSISKKTKKQKEKEIDRNHPIASQTMDLLDKDFNCLKYAQRVEGNHEKTNKQKTKGNQENTV